MTPATWDEAVDAFYAAARQIMLDRQAKYGPANVTAQGLYGILTRLAADKVARVMKSLTGRVIEGRVELDPITDAADESFDDTLFDIANYALIAWMLRKGYWTLPRKSVETIEAVMERNGFDPATHSSIASWLERQGYPRRG